MHWVFTDDSIDMQVKRGGCLLPSWGGFPYDCSLCHLSQCGLRDCHWSMEYQGKAWACTSTLNITHNQDGQTHFNIIWSVEMSHRAANMLYNFIQTIFAFSDAFIMWRKTNEQPSWDSSVQLSSIQFLIVPQEKYIFAARQHKNTKTWNTTKAQ